MLDEYCTVLGTGGADGNVIIWASDGNLGNILCVHCWSQMYIHTYISQLSSAVYMCVRYLFMISEHFENVCTLQHTDQVYSCECLSNNRLLTASDDEVYLYRYVYMYI